MEPIEIPEPPEPEPIPDVGPVVVDQPLARRTLTIAFGVIGCCLAILTILGVMLFIRVGDAVDTNHDAIRRLNRLTHPTKRQFEADLKTGIQRCLRSRECRKLFPAIKRTRNGATQRGNSRKATLGRTPGTVAVTPESQRGNAAPHRSGPTATTNPPSRRPEPAGGSSPPPSPPPQSGGPTPPSATIPGPVRVCSDLVRVNCP